ncbi:amine oxidase [flavin-containing] A-like, partial [Saccoglossus kowalevskii]|uniref:Amine oxidase n=1 Tax=Saccoglossus kowalevskii TaxID=10224 RepID=A0ABM0MNG6_SACKO
MGSVIKTVTYYKTAFWETKGFHGSCIVIDDTEPVNFILNDTKPDGSYPALLSYIPGGKAISWNQKSSEERKAALCKLYSKIFKSEDALQPINYLEFAWIGTPFIGGGHSPFYPPGVITGYARYVLINVYFCR